MAMFQMAARIAAVVLQQCLLLSGLAAIVRELLCSRNQVSSDGIGEGFGTCGSLSSTIKNIPHDALPNWKGWETDHDLRQLYYLVS